MPKQKRPNNLHDVLHNDHFRKDPVKFIIYSASVEEKNVIILRNKELSVNFEEVCFLFHVYKGKKQTKAKTKMFFRARNLVVPNNVMVKTADTHVLIIVLTNIQKLPASMRV